MTAVEVAPTTAGGARPKEEKGTISGRTGSARRFCSSRSRAVEAAKGRAPASAVVAASVADNLQCQRTQLRWWKIPRHWLATMSPFPSGHVASAQEARGGRGKDRGYVVFSHADGSQRQRGLRSNDAATVQDGGIRLINRASGPFHQYLRGIVRFKPCLLSLPLKLSQDLLRSPWVY